MKNTLSILFILLFTFVQAQSDDSLTKKQIRKQRPTYLVLTTGLNRSIFRDLATSPLFYRGVIPSFLARKVIAAPCSSLPQIKATS